MSSKYQITIHDAFGTVLERPKDWVEIDYARVENDVGQLTLILPGSYPSSLFKWHGRIAIERSVDGQQFYLDTQTMWLIESWEKLINGKQRVWTIQAQCLNRLLADREVDYNGQNAYSLKLAAADDMGKAIVRENLGSLVLDSTRNLSAYLSVAANLGAGPSTKQAFENRKVLDILQQIAKDAFQKGTYLVFDIVCPSMPGPFEFRSYTGQRGTDHRASAGGTQPVLVGPDFQNMTETRVLRDYRDAFTRGIVAGSGLSSIAPKARANNTAMQNLSPFGLVEAYQTAANANGDATVLQASADSLVKAGRGKTIITGRLAETTGFKYGVHWKWGDTLTAQADGESIDVHVERVRVNVKQQGYERVDGVLRGES